MSRRRALVAQARIPEIDRDTGAQRVDLFMRWLLERDWAVTFLATTDDIDNSRNAVSGGIPCGGQRR